MWRVLTLGHSGRDKSMKTGKGRLCRGGGGRKSWSKSWSRGHCGQWGSLCDSAGAAPRPDAFVHAHRASSTGSELRRGLRFGDLEGLVQGPRWCVHPSPGCWAHPAACRGAWPTGPRSTPQGLLSAAELCGGLFPATVAGTGVSEITGAQAVPPSLCAGF